MSSLTSTQINQTYPGLLKLEDATSGITNTLQTIQDGLGNDLPLKVKNGQIQGQNLFSFGYFVADYEGLGFTGTGVQFPAGAQNNLASTPFYNNGLNSFSAITYRIITATTSSDNVQLSFYSTQYVNGLGLQPKDLVMSGITLETASTGVKTTTLPSTLSFSGLNSGIYFVVLKASNATSVQPTIRYAGAPTNAVLSAAGAQIGFTFDAANTVITSPFKTTTAGGTSGCGMVYLSLANYQTSFVPADFSGGIFSASTYPGLGFALNVIK